MNDVFLQPASYTLAHGASGFAKNQSYVTPDIKKRENYHSVQIGEDAYFRRSDAIGVADGVGGWSNVKSSNPALYSRKLMHHAYLELEKFENIEDPYFQKYEEASPLDVLQSSYEKTCLAILRHAELRIANLGDCGISVIRHHNYIFQSEEQQHSFNFPFQLGSKSPDKPRDAQSFTVRVQKGDIIIMGSDGLFDNLFDKDILSIVQSLVGPQAMSDRFMPIKPQIISDALAKKAKSVSQTGLESPFQNKATNEGIYYQGGKVDDISVVVAIVQDSESAPDRRL
ncbi:hypothetical protein G6F56_000864 [Rhizopus delemar]|uniref:Protein phosphatase n=1 Tax=Rhizopus stolonifer TaxID=4846 RepID=A0A367KU96_RHIST|nr:hypothetical protein G6F56_000864 [Rhizopus delemar]RCI05781.1 hypothetical protein CU098_012091 [Rhizopus stolonifer]